jgi:hypothetical protein
MGSARATGRLAGDDGHTQGLKLPGGVVEQSGFSGFVHVRGAFVLRERYWILNSRTELFKRILRS